MDEGVIEIIEFDPAVLVGEIDFPFSLTGRGCRIQQFNSIISTQMLFFLYAPVDEFEQRTYNNKSSK